MRFFSDVKRAWQMLLLSRLIRMAAEMPDEQ